MYTLDQAVQKYNGVLRLDDFISRSTLSWLRFIFLVVAILTGSVYFVLFLLAVNPPINYLLGISLISFSLWLEQISLYAYHNSFYFFGLHTVLDIPGKRVGGTTYEVAVAVSKKPEDISYAFCSSQLGTMILIRAGVDQNELVEYLKGTRQKISSSGVIISEEKIFTLITLGKYLLQQDLAFKNLIIKQGITEEIFIETLEWVVLSHHNEKKAMRWWSRDNLSKNQGIGKGWSYGTPHLLQKYSKRINTSAVFSSYGSTNSSFFEDKIQEIEMALASERSSNILLIGEAGVGKMDLLMAIDKRLQEGKSLGSVTNLRMIPLDTNRILTNHTDKHSLEYSLVNIFTEAYNAGNIVIIIENISLFIKEAETMGVYIPELLDEFLASTQMHVIATDTPGAYHTHLEQLSAFTRRFQEVLIDTPNLKNSINLLQNLVYSEESKHQILFTYTALVAIATSADRYLVDGVMPEKAITLLNEVAVRAEQSKETIITPDYVYSLVSTKTGIPAGPISEDEKSLLLNLEKRLHERVIGQERALEAIAKTMRRARVGIQSADKPIGSFLFLGPTGVGKTETAKALAYVFFKSEANMLRLDMSEFSGSDALTKLLGQDTSAGVLADGLRDHPYSVLLLDEFEKAHRAVHDLFLQILDEGFFTDGRGDKVNARNTIIIATSNAGSDLIMRTVEQRQSLATLNQEITKNIIETGAYRPELLNRFDSVIIFEPLTQPEQAQVAGLMLGNLYERIQTQGYQLNINQDLINILVKKGYHPTFGARPMQRVIQDLIEEKVAQKIINGSVQVGDLITLSPADFTPAELA